MTGVISDIVILTTTTSGLVFLLGFVFECGRSCFKLMAPVTENNDTEYEVREEDTEDDTEEETEETEDDTEDEDLPDLDDEKECEGEDTDELECEDGVCMIKDKIKKITDIISSTDVSVQIEQITKLMESSDIDLFKQSTEKILKVLPEFTNLFSVMDILQQDKMPTMRDEMNKISEGTHTLQDDRNTLSDLVSELKEQLN